MEERNDMNQWPRVLSTQSNWSDKISGLPGLLR